MLLKKICENVFKIEYLNVKRVMGVEILYKISTYQENIQNVFYF